MTAQRTLDVASLPDHSISNQAPLWWGQLLLTMIEAAMFGILIAMYFYYRLSLDVWPPPGTQLPRLLLPTAGVVVLIASALGSYWASEGAKKDDPRTMLMGMVLNVALAFVFLALRAVEWWRLNFNWKANVHGSLVWSVLGLHSLDAVADVGFTIVLIVLVMLGRHDRRVRTAVHVDSVVWYFIVLIWLPLYVVVFWGPRIVGAP